jgi:hypothetical protein
VKTINKILVLVFSVLYLFLSTGVMLFQTHCECLGSASVSLFVAADSCDDAISEDDCCSTRSNCINSQTEEKLHSCGCESPVVSYLKLSEHFDEGSNFEYPLAKIINMLNVAVIETVEQILPEKSPINFTHYSRPENKKAGRNLINFLNQRKIALSL